MADDTIITTQEVADQSQAVDQNTQSWDQNTDAQGRAQQAAGRTTDTTQKTSTAFNDLNKFVSTSSDQLQKLTGYLDAVGIKLDETTKLTQGQQVAFGALSSLLLGASTAFNNLTNIDTRGLNTFSSQIDALGDRIKDSPLYKYGEAVAAQSGKTGQQIAQFATNFVKNMAASADQAVRLENAVIQLSARTGSLSDLQRVAGANFENINAVVEQQNKIIQSAADTFQLTSAQVANYYTELGQIPGAINAVIPGSGKLGDNVSSLNAAMLLAKGSGRDFTSIVNDMKVGFENYNLTTEESLQFTARMTELSTKFKIPLEDVNRSLVNISNSFGIFGKEAEGAARLYNNYLGALQNTGISGPQAVKIVESMTQNLSSLGIAQKAFLSAQTGGPGGLLGGFQIEEQLKSGKIDEVFERVRTTLSKQFGKIVTLEEGAQSQAAAQQLEKQVLLLTQGPLGQLVKSPQEAYRVLEAFRAKDEGGPAPALDKDFLQKTMESGDDLTKQTNTILGGMARDIEKIRDQASFLNLNTIQGVLTAGTGAGQKTPDTEATANLRRRLNDRIRTSNEAGAAGVRNVQGSVIEGRVSESRNTTQTDALKALSGLADIPKDILTAGESVVSHFAQEVANLPKGQADTAKKEYLNQLAQYREDLTKQNLSSSELSKNVEDSFKAENTFKASFAKYGGGTTSTAIGEASPTFKINEAARPSAALSAQAAAVASSAPIPAANLERVNPARQNVPDHGTGNLGEITVHVDGFCINCKSRIDGKSQSYSVNPVSKLP
jgi:hypothetical protein